ncbi:MAG: hypothetical protein WKG07_19940 [Hymenobacter sp.]
MAKLAEKVRPVMNDEEVRALHGHPLRERSPNPDQRHRSPTCSSSVRAAGLATGIRNDPLGAISRPRLPVTCAPAAAGSCKVCSRNWRIFRAAWAGFARL